MMYYTKIIIFTLIIFPALIYEIIIYNYNFIQKKKNVTLLLMKIDETLVTVYHT